MRTLIGLVFVSTAALAQQPAKWRLVEEWRVGGDVDGAHSFADTRGMAMLPDGRIVIVDYKDAQVHFLDAKGQKIRTVGRPGAGPGEFDKPNGLAVSPNGNVIVNDPVGNNRYTLLASNGDFIRTIPFLNRTGYGAYWDARYNEAGLLDENVSVRRPGESSSIAARRIWSADFAKSDTIMPTACAAGPRPDQRNFIYEFRGANGSMMMSIPYVSPITSYVRSSDGSTWAGSFPGFMSLSHKPPGKCSPDVTIALRGGRLAIPSAIRDSTIAMVKTNAARYNAPLPDFGRIPTEFPPYDELVLDQSNRLWVNRLIDAKRHRFDVYSATGVLLAEVDIPFPFRATRPMIITNDRILGFVTDEDDIVHLISARIVR